MDLGRDVDLHEFAEYIKDLSGQIGFKVSARGWAYLLETRRLVNKDQFDRVNSLINQCRKKGLLPINFVAEDSARMFQGVDVPSKVDVVTDLGEWLKSASNTAEYYDLDWWDGEEYYIQMVVEKVDLVTLFSPICREYHIPIANCFDDKTEILTDKGWIKFDDIDYTYNAASKDGNGDLIYTPILNITKQKYNGDMYHIQNRGTDQCVTPNHNSYIARQRNKKDYVVFELCDTKSVVHLQNLRFSKKINFNGPIVDKFHLPIHNNSNGNNTIKKHFNMNDWLKFLGYYLSEGSCLKKDRNQSYIVRIYQKKSVHPGVYNDIKNCCKSLGYNFYENDCFIEISNKQLYNYLSIFGDHCSKFIPREFLNLHKKQLKILLDSLVAGDGHVRGSDSMSYASTSKDLADDVQELALKAGYFASMSTRTKDELNNSIINGRTISYTGNLYIVNICKSRNYFRINHGKKDWQKINYNGYVHCVEVETGLVYVRRNGKPVWSGNSKGWSSMLQRAEYARRFALAERQGLKCVLLYMGDHDPDGLRISDFIRKNLVDIQDVKWSDGLPGYKPYKLIIERFGLNFDFIEQNNLTWIDNLITGSGKNLASPSHRNFNMEYVQQYLSEIGERKCEANAVVTMPDSARDLIRKTIEGYLGEDALDRFEERRQAIRDELDAYLDNSGVGDKLDGIIDEIDER